MFNDNNNTMTLIILGPSAVGKSALVNCLQNEDFTEEYTPTTAIDFAVIAPLSNAKNLKFITWEIAGGTRYAGFIDHYIKSASLIIFMCDISQSDQEVSDAIQCYFEIFEKSINENTRIFIVGTKLDLCNASTSEKNENDVHYAKAQSDQGTIEDNNIKLNQLDDHNNPNIHLNQSARLQALINKLANNPELKKLSNAKCFAISSKMREGIDALVESITSFALKLQKQNSLQFRLITALENLKSLAKKIAITDDHLTDLNLSHHKLLKKTDLTSASETLSDTLFIELNEYQKILKDDLSKDLDSNDNIDQIQHHLPKIRQFIDDTLTLHRHLLNFMRQASAVNNSATFSNKLNIQHASRQLNQELIAYRNKVLRLSLNQKILIAAVIFLVAVACIAMGASIGLVTGAILKGGISNIMPTIAPLAKALSTGKMYAALSAASQYETFLLLATTAGASLGGFLGIRYSHTAMRHLFYQRSLRQHPLKKQIDDFAVAAEYHIKNQLCKL